MTPAARQLVEALLAARNAGSSEQVRALLAPDATYWDCLTGWVRGADAVTETLVASRAGSGRPHLIADTLAAADRHAVAELRVREAGEGSAPGYPATEVYELGGGLVTACRAYLDPAEVSRA